MPSIVAFVCVGHPYSFQYIVLVRDDDVLSLPSSHTSLASPNTRDDNDAPSYTDEQFLEV
jgi:hypothetical protein